MLVFRNRLKLVKERVEQREKMIVKSNKSNSVRRSSGGIIKETKLLLCNLEDKTIIKELKRSFKDSITDGDIDILFEENNYKISKLSEEKELMNLKFITTDETYNEILKFINENEKNVVIIKKY